jgi:hypothetical protein
MSRAHRLVRRVDFAIIVIGRSISYCRRRSSSASESSARSSLLDHPRRSCRRRIIPLWDSSSQTQNTGIRLVTKAEQVLAPGRIADVDPVGESGFCLIGRPRRLLDEMREQAKLRARADADAGCRSRDQIGVAADVRFRPSRRAQGAATGRPGAKDVHHHRCWPAVMPSTRG